MFWLRKKKKKFNYTLLSGGLNGIEKHSQDKTKFFSVKLSIFSYPSVLTFVLGAQKNHEMITFCLHSSANNFIAN